jgi:hypothetical protein
MEIMNNDNEFPLHYLIHYFSKPLLAPSTRRKIYIVLLQYVFIYYCSTTVRVLVVSSRAATVILI